jgi:hypothetical protein
VESELGVGLVGMVVVMVEMGIAMRMTHIQVDRCMRWLVTILVVVVVVVVSCAGLISERDCLS